jgi:hypothetical protein
VQSAFFKELPSLHLPPNIVVKPAPLGQQDFMNQTLNGLGQGLDRALGHPRVLADGRALQQLPRPVHHPLLGAGRRGRRDRRAVLTHKTLNLFSLIGTILLSASRPRTASCSSTTRTRCARAAWRSSMRSARARFTRFRPIVMTSVSVMIGNLPLALALEPGSSARSSLGIVIIGGVFSSLVLTLLARAEAQGDSFDKLRVTASTSSG